MTSPDPRPPDPPRANQDLKPREVVQLLAFVFVLIGIFAYCRSDGGTSAGVPATAPTAAPTEPSSSPPEQAAVPAAVPAANPDRLGSSVTLRLLANEDSRTPIKDSISRDLLAEGAVDEAGLRAALTDYYARMRAELDSSKNPTRHVWLFAYPTTERARAGQGEWIGRANATAFQGAPLPSAPEITIRLPRADVAVPTAREDKIYDELMQELAATDSAGAYQERIVSSGKRLTTADVERMAELNEQDEKRVMRKVAKKYKMTVGALEELHIKVVTARQ